LKGFFKSSVGSVTVYKLLTEIETWSFQV